MRKRVNDMVTKSLEDLFSNPIKMKQKSLSYKPKENYHISSYIINVTTQHLYETYETKYKKNSLGLSLYKQINELKEKYEFIEEKEVFDFLLENHFLIALIKSAYYTITDYFPVSKLILNMYKNPEDIKEKQLIIYIKTNLPIEEALDTLFIIDKNWWITIAPLTKNKLCIDVC